MTNRLAPQPGEVIDRARPFSFNWQGRPYPSFAGDTIVSALAACGERVFSRSFKYHRRRGILSATYFDPNCTVQVGDEPNVRGAHRRVVAGMDVRPQNAWPSLNFDLKAANRLIGRFLAPGFYYKTFIQPGGWWSFYRHLFKGYVAGGALSQVGARGYYDQRYGHPDVLVAGGGPAGMAAALAAARAGAQVMLVDEEHELGGHLRWGDAAELAALSELRAAVAAEPLIEVLTDSVVAGRYDDNWIAVVQRDFPFVVERLIKARAKVLVVAVGLIERPLVFEGNDLPGVMLSTAVRRLVNLYAVKPGERAVVLSANPEGDAAAADLERAGIRLAALVDARRGQMVVRAKGRKAVGEVELNGGTRVQCDLLVLACGWTAPTLLLNMSGDRPVYSVRAARFTPGGGLPDMVLATGGIAGDGTLAELLAHATATGTLAAARAGFGSAEPVSELAVRDHPALFRGPTHGMVDWSEDVSSADLLSAAEEGYESIEHLKRYTAATMGPAQGKFETINTVAMLAEAKGRTIGEVGTTTWRPPYAPITLGALAGRGFEPVYLSPMQPWHEAHAACPLVAGQWIRPEHYGDPQAEVANTREHVGIIDITPLGKFDLRGPDVQKLLDLLYFKQWSRVPVGAVRYGVMCTEDGVVYDDGVVARLGEDHYLMTTTSANAASVGEWIEGWLQGARPPLRVYVTPMVASFASINVAGPNARELLRRVVRGVDLDPVGFAHMQARVATVAGVAGCYMMRLGFVGELSYEIHVPGGFGLHVWEVLVERGQDLGLRPFGVAAQRIMRLEKGHPIVGQDTDALTQALSLGPGAAKNLDRHEFSGKPEIRWQAERASYPRLVGLRPLGTALAPPEGCQIVDGDRRIVGRITSSCVSPMLGRPICMGLVGADLAAAGTVVSVLLPDGSRVAAEVTSSRVHFDPEAIRLNG